MTKFLLAPLLLFTFSVQASHNTACDVDAKVTSVTSPGRLDAAVVYSRQPDLVAPDFEELLTFEITKVFNQTGTSDCGLKAGEVATLIVDKTKVGRIKKDQNIKLEYQNFGDAAASKIFWAIRR